MIKLYNTLGRELQDFEPLVKGKIGFYGCGPTVYDYSHIGNLRAFFTHDILIRTLRRFGYEVNHVMNITDVGHLTGDSDDGEDKMLKSAAERGKSVLEIAEFYTNAFFKDIERLNIIKPNVICKATEHIPEMIELIKRIEENGFTYFADGNLYFDISKSLSYGELALLRLDMQKAGARTDIDKNKRNAGDFVLWFTKGKFIDQALLWDSPWGMGYPGWHIECSAMSMKYIGEEIDIHAGGIDHIPVHHTNEIAQTEAATGKKPWVKYWIHNEFLIMNKEKMSKSEGGFITLQSLIDFGFSALDYRYFLLQGHYRSQLQFSLPALESARNSRRALTERLRLLMKEAGEEIKPLQGTNTYLEAFNKALSDDISTPKALAELWGLIKDPALSPAEALAAAFDMDGILGLNLKEEAKPVILDDSQKVAEIERLISERQEAKNIKNYKRSDEIRQILHDMGIILEDTAGGTTWKIKL